MNKTFTSTTLALLLVASTAIGQAVFEPYTFTTFAGAAGSGSADGTGQAARFNRPSDVAIGGDGNLYVVDSYNNTIRKVTPAGVVTTFASVAGAWGTSDGSLTTARFNVPRAIAIGSDGTIYIADQGNNSIRKITTAGAVSKLASITQPQGVAVDSSGNVFVTSNNKINKVTSGGTVSVVAGSGSFGSTNGQGTAASFASPQGLVLDAAGNIYVADQGNNEIRKIDSQANVTTVAGAAGQFGDVNGDVSVARFGGPQGITIDNSGNLYVTDFSGVRKITFGASTTVSQVAGTFVGAADGVGTAAQFFTPHGITVDASGVLYVADEWNNTIRKIATDATVTTLAGLATSGSTDGAANVARFNQPGALAGDNSAIYVADMNSDTIRKIDGVSRNVTTLAGTAGIFGRTDGTGTSAQFGQPQGIAADGAGNVYVADTGNNTIRKIDSAANVTTIAGSAGQSGSTDAIGTAARFTSPQGLVFDPSVAPAGALYVADSGNNTIRKVALVDGTVTTLAGTAGPPGYVDATGSAARFSRPHSVAVDTSGNVYVADTGNNRIRQITPAGVVTTFVNGTGNSANDGTGPAVGIITPFGIAVDGQGNAYVTSLFSHTIRKITPAGTTSTIGGLPNISGGADGVSSKARFFNPQGLWVDGAGTVYVADESNQTVRQGFKYVAPSTPTPTPTPADRVSFTGVGFAGPDDNFSEVRSANGNGNAVGDSSHQLQGSAFGYEPTRWSLSTGTQQLPGLAADGTRGGSTFVTASDVTSSGSWIAYRAKPGNLGRREAIICSADLLTVIGLGRLPNSTNDTFANQISDDGTVVFGQGFDSAFHSHAFRWTQATGIQQLPEPSAAPLTTAFTQSFPVARANSSDGSVSAGDMQAFDQNGNETAHQAYVWTVAGGMQGIGYLPGGNRSETLAMTPDGSKALGISNSTNSPGNTYFGELFLWDATNGMRSIGRPAGYDNFGNFGGISADAALVVVEASDSTGTNPDAGFILQTATGKFYRVDDVLRSAGAAIDGWTSLGIFGISDDGTTLFGAGADPNGNTQGWVAHFPPGYLANFTPPKQNVLGEVGTRAFVGTGANVLISGFIVDDSSNTGATKKVLIEGLGPSLQGITGTLANPTLELHSSNGAIVASNDDWQSTQQADIEATGQAPSDSHESAVVTTLPAGPYTAILRGANNTTGVGEVKVFDIDGISAARIGNEASRAGLVSDSDPAVADFVVNGPQFQKVYIRGLGASLASSGVSNPLQDPMLTLRDASGNTLVFNDNWKDTQQADIQATGLAPSDDREPAIVVTLPPGKYTATLLGRCSLSGTANVEVYDLGPNGTTSSIPASSNLLVCPSPTPVPTPTATPTPTAIPIATPTPTPTPTPVVTPTPTPSATPTPTPIATATPTPTPVPNNPPSVVLTTTDNGGLTPPNGTKLTVGQSFTMSATASDDHAVASVAFLVDGAVLSRSTSAPYQATVTLFAAGDHVLSARATDDQGASTDSNSVTITMQPASGTTYTFVGAAGADWSDANNWSPTGVPGTSDLAELKSGQSATISGNVMVGSLTLAGGSSITGTGTLNLTNTLTFTSGSISGVHVVVPVNGKLVFTGDSAKTLADLTIDNSGIVTCTGTGAITGNSGTVLNNAGTFTISSSAGVAPTTATFNQFTNAGLVQIKGTLTVDGYTQSSGQLDLNGYNDDGSVAAALAVIQGNTITLNGGTLTGSGTIIGNLLNNGAAIVPGHSAGVLSVQGNYTQGPNASLVLEIGGTETGQYDQLIVTGTAQLDGTLDVRTINNFTPDPTATFTPLQITTVTGDFQTTSSNADVTVTSKGVEVQVTAPNPPPPQAQNISTRLSVQTGENVLIGGFIITGPSGTTKHIAVRGIGPSLSALGVSDALSDPLLELHNSDGTVVVNDNWQDAANASDVPDVLKPKDPRESVLVRDLGPGGYSAIVKGANGETGVGLAEVYDLDQPSYTQLANISTRGFVQTGDDVMIGGFIIGGTEPAKVLVRAIGPSLSKFGVTNPLADPTLEVHDSNGAVLSNDDWRNTQEAEIQATTIPPSDDHESALLATLPHGNYTAIVRGKENASGVALVEVYMLE